MTAEYNFEALRDKVDDKFTHARIQCLIKQPFFGTLISGTPVVYTNSERHPWCNTMSTDGQKMYVNVDYADTLTGPQTQFMLAHLILHLALDHPLRRRGRNEQVWDMATDYLVNAMLVESRVGSPPADALLEARYHSEMVVEEIYDDLIKNSTEIKLPLDNHLDGNGGASGDSTTGEASVRVFGDGDGPPILSDDEIDAIREQLLNRLVQAQTAASAGGGVGNVPAGIRRMIRELTEPKIDWRDLVDSSTRSQATNDYTFSRLSRVDVGMGFILPAEDNDFIVEADVLIDTSGSMNDEMIREILSEIKGIMMTFQDFELRVCSFDTELYDYDRIFTPANIDDLMSADIKGGGGTDPTCYWDRIKADGRVPKQLIIFTDGYIYNWGDPEYCDTLWIFHGGNRDVAPFGVTVYYEDANMNR